MRKFLAIMLALAFTVTPASALANDSLAPTMPEIAQAWSIARAYWGGNPSCGQPTAELGQMDGFGGIALIGTCRTIYNNAHDWRDFPSKFCDVTVHEWGHHVLGATYFQATNPSDPAHAPVGTTGGMAIMVASDGKAAACNGMANSERAPVKITHRHHRRHRRR